MSARPDPILEALRDARPADPGPDEAQSTAVRVLARVAVLEAGARARPPRRRLARLGTAVAAGIVAAFVLLAGGSPGPEAPTPPPVVADAPPSVASPWAHRVTAALSGDALAERRVVHGGPAARRALLDAAETAIADAREDAAVEALRLLAAAGRLRGEAESLRVAGLAGRAPLRPAAVALLGEALGPYGARALEALLVEDHEAEPLVVAALTSMAERGRREPALRALLAGARHGRVEAAAAALRVAGASALVTNFNRSFFI